MATCELCQVPMERQHTRRFLHKHMVEVRSIHKAATDEFETLEDKIKAAGKLEPLLGLEYIIRFGRNNKGFIMYQCKLCSTFVKAEDSFFHIVGIPHRHLYLKIKGLEGKHTRYDTVEIFENFLNRCRYAETTYGRQNIAVVPLPSDIQQGDKESSTGSGEQSESGAANVPLIIHGRGLTFKELKAMHEAKLRDTRKRNSRGTTKEKEPDCDVDSFCCKEELFEFLENFSVENQHHCVFVLKAAQILTKALVKHKRVMDLRGLISGLRKRADEDPEPDEGDPEFQQPPMIRTRAQIYAERGARSRMRALQRLEEGQSDKPPMVKLRPVYNPKKQRGSKVQSARVLNMLKQRWAAKQKGKRGPAYNPKKQRGSKAGNPKATQKGGKQGPAKKKPENQTDSGAEKHGVSGMIKQLQAGRARLGIQCPDKNTVKPDSETVDPGVLRMFEQLQSVKERLGGRRGPPKNPNNQSGYGKGKPGGSQMGKRQHPGSAQPGKQVPAKKPKNRPDPGAENSEVNHMIKQLHDARAQLGIKGPASNPESKTVDPGVLRMFEQLKSVKDQLRRRGPFNNPNNQRGSVKGVPGGRKIKSRGQNRLPGYLKEQRSPPGSKTKTHSGPKGHQPPDSSRQPSDTLQGQLPSQVPAAGGASSSGDGKQADVPQ